MAISLGGGGTKWPTNKEKRKELSKLFFSMSKVPMAIKLEGGH